VQVEPMKPVLKAPGIERLKLKHDRPLSNFAFNFNLRRYTAAWRTEWAAVRHYLSAGRRPNTHRPRFTINLTVVCLQCTGGPVHTRRILLPGTACRLLTVYRWTRAHSPHPPPRHCLSFAYSVPVDPCTLAASSSLALPVGRARVHGAGRSPVPADGP